MTIEVETLLVCLLAVVISAAVCFVCSPFVMRLAGLVGAIDVPNDDRRMHKKPIPRLGGLAIFAGFLVSVLFLTGVTKQVQGILLGAVIIVLLGALDDIYRLPAWIKLIVQIIAAILPVSHGVVIERFSNPLFFMSEQYIMLGMWSAPITVIWFVMITNSVNLIDGLDGLAVGVSAIASFSLLVISLLLPQPVFVPIIVAALTGSCLGFLPFNTNPAKMFMGDTGSTFLGFILAAISIQGLFKFYAIISFAVPFLILGLPIFDTGVAILRRISKGKSPMSADRSHVHHKLIDMGFSQKQSVVILYAVSAVLGLSAVVLTTSGEIKALLFVLAVMVACIIGFNAFRAGLAVKKETPAKTDTQEADTQSVDTQSVEDNNEQ